MSTRNYLGTFVSDMKSAGRIIAFRERARDKALAHRKFRRLGRQLLRRGLEPPKRMSFGYYA